MSEYRVHPSKLGAVFRAGAKRALAATREAAVVAAERGRALLVRRSPVYLGLFRAAWKVTRGREPTITNSAPYAGVIERGARPHAVSQEGIEAIAEWARLKLGLDEKESRNVAYGVAKRLAAEGQEGHFLVRDALPMLTAYYASAVEDALRRAHRPEGAS